MYCLGCGQNLEDGATFCKHCGTKTDNINAGTTQQSAPAPASTQSNTFAVLGLVFAFLMPILGIIFSAMGMSKSKELNGNGRGMAIAGLVISIVEIVISIVAVVIIMTFYGDILHNFM